MTPEIQVVDRVVEMDSVPSRLFSDIEAVVSARDDREVMAAAARAVFSLEPSAQVTFTVRSREEGVFVICDNYRDGRPREAHVGEPVRIGSLTSTSSRLSPGSAGALSSGSPT